MAFTLRWPGEKKRQKLWRDGAITHGVVSRIWWHSQLEGTYGIEFRTRFPDGTTADLKEHFLIVSRQGRLAIGDTVPVRYDPARTSRVRLDVPALEAPVKAAVRAAEARRDEALEHLGQTEG